MSGRDFLAVCLTNQNCGARPPRGRAALSKWFAPANRRDEGVPHRPFGPPPHCGGEALETTSNAVQNRPHIVFLAMIREETESDDVIARRPSGRRGNPELVYLTVVSFSVDEDLFRLGFADPPSPEGKAFGGTDCHVASLLAITRNGTESNDVIARRPSGRRGNPVPGARPTAEGRAFSTSSVSASPIHLPWA